MGIFSKKTAIPQQVEYLCSKRLSRVIERAGGEEITLGGKGGASVCGGELVIVCDGKEVFRCDIKGITAAQLMSGNGCDIKGISGGEKRHIIAYYGKNI